MSVDKNPVGRPKKPETVTAGLRTDKTKWEQIKAKYPNKINKMFNDWLDGLLESKSNV